MKHTVLFLGAGASKSFGLPLTGELLPMMLEEMKTGRLFGDQAEKCTELDTGLRSILPGIFDLEPRRLPMITDVLSLLDHLHGTQRLPLPGMSPDTLLRLRRLLEEGLVRVLNTAREQHAPDKKAVLTRFADWIVQRMQQEQVSIISTNYDIAIDMELLERLHNILGPQNTLYDRSWVQEKIDLGLHWRNVDSGEVMYPPQQPRLSLYKIHGSVNWLHCGVCDHVYFNPWGEIITLAYQQTVLDVNSCHCGHGPLQALIVAPSLERDIRDANLVHIWKSALERMRTADEWIIAGYSLPAEDIPIKSMFLRALHARGQEALRQAPDIQVVQYGDDALPRYQALFGKVTYYNAGLVEYLDRQQV